MQYTVKKYRHSSTNPEKEDQSLEMKFTFDLRPVNELHFYNFFKMDLLKIP